MDPLRGPDVATRLLRALHAGAAASGTAFEVTETVSRPWASATFSGEQHHLVIQADPIPGFRSWLAALPDAELPLRGHILADLAIDAVEQVGSRLRVTIAALTLIDA
jgi:hypothetical protein